MGKEPRREVLTFDVPPVVPIDFIPPMPASITGGSDPCAGSGNWMHCPECGSDSVECIERPHHDHLCYTCGFRMLPDVGDET